MFIFWIALFGIHHLKIQECAASVCNYKLRVFSISGTIFGSREKNGDFSIRVGGYFRGNIRETFNAIIYIDIGSFVTSCIFHKHGYYRPYSSFRRTST